MLNKNKKIVNELFESKALIYYPTDKDQYHFVQAEELDALQEMDKEDPMNDYGDDAANLNSKNVKQVTFDLTQS